MVRGEHGLGHESAGVVVKIGPGVTIQRRFEWPGEM